jgi:hypothetical protein
LSFLLVSVLMLDLQSDNQGATCSLAPPISAIAPPPTYWIGVVAVSTLFGYGRDLFVPILAHGIIDTIGIIFVKVAEIYKIPRSRILRSGSYRFHLK